MKDSNVALTFNGLLNVDKDHPYYKATVNVEGMDLQALHFTTDVQNKAAQFSGGYDPVRSGVDCW